MRESELRRDGRCGQPDYLSVHPDADRWLLLRHSLERRLCEEVELHLAYRWFCRLDLDDKVPDHSTFSVNRHGRFRDSGILRHVFEAVVRACMDAGLVTPHIPVWDKSSREDGTFSRTDFTFDSDRNLYVCPANKLLTTTGSVGADHVLRYRARKRECQVCPLKPQCCPKTPSRKVTRDLNEAARDLRDLREILRLSGVTWSTHQQWLKQHCGEHGTGEREGHQLPHAGCTGMT